MGSSRWQTAILDLVRGEGRASISALADSLQVSGETIRRHIRPMVAEGVLTRSHGEVALAGGGEPPFQRRMSVQAPAKRAIARAVAELVPDGASVMLDTGSTAVFVAEALCARRGLTVITNALEIARPFVGRNDHRVCIAGGEISPELGAVLGPGTLAFLARFRADIAILTAGAIDPARGLADFRLDEAEVAQAMLARADRAVAVADRAKFEARAPVTVCPLAALDILVTDAPPPATAAAALAAAQVEVVVAAPLTP